MLTSDDLKAFQAVAGEGNLSKAARALKMSQPSLTYIIKKVETTAGSKLFHRSTKGMMLTIEGERFAGKVEHLLQQWFNLLGEIQTESERQQWTINLGCHPSVACYTLPMVLPELLQEYPQLRLRLHHGLSREINNNIIECKIDLGIVINPSTQADLIIKQLAQDVVCLWQCPGNTNLDTLIYDPSLAQSQWILRRLEREHLHFSRHIESGNLEVISTLVAAGAGCGIVPSRVVKQGAVRCFPEKKIEFIDTICLVYRSNFREKVPGRAIIAALTEKLNSPLCEQN